MASQENDNLATLLEPDEADVVEELMDRFKRGINFVNCGDCVLAIKPQSLRHTYENSPENGKRYCSKRPIPDLPAHVYALAHRVYRDAISQKSNIEPHSVLISGIEGSGKTEVSEMLIAQFLREAGVSRKDDSPFTLLKGLTALKRLMTVKSTSGPTSSLASVVVTLYFGQKGTFKTAKMKVHLLNPRHVIPHTQGRGYLNIFYDLVAALLNGAPGLSIREEHIHIVLQGMDPALTRMSQEDFADHKNHWLGLLEIIQDLNIGEDVPLSRQDSTNSFLDTMLGLLLLATTQLDIDQQTNQVQVRNAANFAIAAQLLGVSDQVLYDSIMSVATKYAVNLFSLDAVQSRNQLVYELYSRLIAWFIEEINGRLPDIEHGDIPIHIVDFQPFLDQSVGNLEDLCQNMVAEYIQMQQNKAVFGRESDACKAEGLKVPVVKRQHCENVVELAFSVPSGILHQLEMLCNNPSVSNEALVKALDSNFKKRKDMYIGSKSLGPGSFAVVHSHKQTEYNVDAAFRHQNLIVLNREAEKLLVASTNPTVQNVFKPAVNELTHSDLKSHFSYVSYVKIQMESLIEQVIGSLPHLVRCIRHSLGSQKEDTDLLMCQVKCACLPDILHRKKFGFSHWMATSDFLKRYRMLDLSLLTSNVTPEEACKNILKKAGIFEKGPAVTKKCVFLSYWHKEVLDARSDEFVWKVTLVQACVRGHLTRKRLHEVIAIRLRLHDEASSSRRHSFLSKRLSSQSQYMDAGESELFESMIARTLTQVSDLPSIVWAKVIYLEQGTEIAKVYAEELSLHVTGSQNPFDGIELGLAYFNHPDRLEETEYIVGNLKDGIEIRRDSDGNILANRHCQMPLCVKHHHFQPVLSLDMLRTRGELPLGHFVKIFDMQEFYSLISLEMQKPNFSKAKLRKACITAIRLGGSDSHIMRLPCWVAVININALNVLDNVEELQSISLMPSQLSLFKDKEDDETKVEQEKAKAQRQRKHWSRSDQRPQVKVREANSRKIREELRSRGERVSDHMKFSWEEAVARRANINMDQLYEKLRKQASEVTSNSANMFGQSSPMKNWAKVSRALREATRDLQRAEVEETSPKVHESL